MTPSLSLCVWLQGPEENVKIPRPRNKSSYEQPKVGISNRTPNPVLWSSIINYPSFLLLVSMTLIACEGPKESSSHM